MKRRNNWKKMLAVLLAALMLAGAVATAVAILITTANAAEVVVNAFDASVANSSHTAKSITSDYGIHLGLGESFSAVSVSIPTWGNPNSSCTLGLYQWSKDYDTTVKAEPLFKIDLTNLSDNAYNTLTFPEQPAGEYFIRIYNTKGQVGVWQCAKSVSKGYCYESGMETEADWEMKITFTKNPAEPFLSVLSALESLGDEYKVPPDEYEIPADSLLNTHKVMPDTWVFTDGLGRVSLTNAEVGAPKEDKTLAIMYWTWHAESAMHGYTDTTSLLAQYPDAKNNYNHPAWEGTGRYCFWNEPIYGYYRTDDAWVLRRQAELLANAGVDVVFADNTNGGITWTSGYLALFKEWSNAQEYGAVNTPKISFSLPFAAHDAGAQQVEELFKGIYFPRKYHNLWFYFDGKPMLMGYSSNLNSTQQNYFTWRAGEPSYTANGVAGRWGWLSTYPQATYTVGNSVEQVTVGVAQNHNYKTHQLSAMNGEYIMGRSYTSDYENRYAMEGSEASKWGYNFAEQWKYALSVNPRVVFVTGWNEWHAFRQEGTNDLVDQFNDEYSRDIEPSKGPLQDHYYYQFVNFSRQYKGCNPIPTPSENVAISLSGDKSQWDSVEPYYAAYIGVKDRDAQGYGDLTYTEDSGRNDIIGAQVARNHEYIYFRVECNKFITNYKNKLWMNLYLDTDQDNQGWNTFEYVINKSPASKDTLVLEKFTADNDYSATEKVADVEYVKDGRYMTIKVRKSDLGITGDDYTINFTWTDNVHDEDNAEVFSGDIMDFYISGDVAPGGRFKYSFISTEQNAGADVEIPVETIPAEETEQDEETDAPETEGNTEAVTDATAESAPDTGAAETEGTTAEDTQADGSLPADTTAPDTDASTETASTETMAPAEGGCGSVVTGVCVLLLSLAGGALAFRKKED